MKIKKKYLAYMIIIIFFLYGLKYEVFERRFLFNELLSFFGISIFLLKSFRKQGKFLLPQSLIYRCVVGLIIFGLFNMFVSFVFKTNLYYYLRNSVIIYAMFSFFVGYYLFHYQVDLLKKLRNVLRIFFGTVVSFGLTAYLDRFSGAVLFPSMYTRYNAWTVFSILVLNIVYAFTFDSLTVLAITVIFIFILVVRNFVLFSIACALGMAAFVFMMIYFSSAIELYKQGPYALFGNVNLVMLQHPLLLIDGNSTWRLIFWYRMIVENFPMNLIGIGFGTPLIDYEPGLTTVDGGNTDEHNAHVIGAHNTYLTVAVRLGVLFLLFVLLVYAKVFKEYYNHFKYYTSRGYFIYFWAFFAISIIGLFNLTLESPIYASLYWVLLGFVARVIEIRKNEALQPNILAESRVNA